MDIRYQLVLQSIDGEMDYNTSHHYKSRPKIRTAERFFKGQIKQGMRITLDTKAFENGEVYELLDRQTLKEY